MACCSHCVTAPCLGQLLGGARPRWERVPLPAGSDAIARLRDQRNPGARHARGVRGAALLQRLLRPHAAGRAHEPGAQSEIPTLTLPLTLTLTLTPALTLTLTLTPALTLILTLTLTLTLTLLLILTLTRI